MFENRLLYCSALTKTCGAHNKIGNLLRLHKSALTIYTLLRTFSLNFIRLLRVVITPSVTSLLRGESDSKQSDEIQANISI